MGTKQQSSVGWLSISVRLMAVIGIITLTTVALVLVATLFLTKQENDSTIINIAGRQRMLTQKMTKEALAITAGQKVAANREALQKTLQLFSKSHVGLLNGDAEMHLPATKDPTILTQMMKVDALWKKFELHVQTVLKESVDSATSKAAIGALLGSNIQLLKEMNRGVGLYEQWSRAKVTFLKQFLYGGLVFALLVTIGCWLFISRKVARPIQQVSGIIQEMEKGHLENRIGSKRTDEIGQMGRTLDAFAESLQQEVADSLQRLAAGDLSFDTYPRDEKDVLRNALRKLGIDLNTLIFEIQEAGNQIASGSDQVSNSSQSLSHGATTTAASLEELTSSLTQLTSQTKLNAENAGQANRLAEEAKLAAESGNSQMQGMVKAMAEINEAGQSVNKIIKVIDEIAFQTNLLALNAAVEAARAGQHGKGFAVVAEEVRNLAARSAKAANETAELIEGSREKAARGAEIADKTEKALGEIVVGISKATDLMGEISAASNEQALGITEISQGLEQIDQVTQTNTATSEETAAAAEELASQAESLHHMLRRFKLHPSTQSTHLPPQEAPIEQVGWQNVVPEADNGTAPAGQSIALDDSEFGKY